MRERRHAQVFLVRRRWGQKLFAAKVITCRYAFYERPAGRGAFAADKGSRCPNAGGVLCLGGTVRAHHGMAPGKNAGAEDTGGRRPGLWETLCLGIRLAGLLQKLHGKKPSIFYLDLKPSNILLRPVRGKAAPSSGLGLLWILGAPGRRRRR